MKILIRDAYIITMNAWDEVIPCGYIAIADGTILSVSSEMPQDFAAERIIDAKGKMVIPGLINLHTHSPMTLFRGYGSDLALQDWLQKKIIPAEARLTDEDCALGTRLAIAEMLLTGTTCFLDMYDHAVPITETTGSLGMRAVISRPVLAFGSYEERLKEAEALYDDYHGSYNGRIGVMMSVHAEYTNTVESVKAAVALAKEKDCGLNIHLAETKLETEECKERHGMSPAQFFASLDALTPSAVAAHCVYLDDADIRLMASLGANVAHNPTSNMKLASGVAPVQKMLDAGVNVGIGTDGAASNNRLDMLSELRQAALVGKLNGGAQAVNAYSALRMATVNGARALGLQDKVGSLEVGKEADMVLLDMMKPWWAPLKDPLSQLVYAAQSTDVCMTMVQGNILMENGTVRGIDIADTMQAVYAAAERLYGEI